MTIRALTRTLVLIGIATCVGLAGCSRENRDWRSAQAADSLESYDQFLQQHPASELAAQARARLLQLTEDRDWQRASTGDTADAYKQFLNQHSSGKHSAEARIRMESFALEGQPLNAAIEQSTPGQSKADPSKADPSKLIAARPVAVVPGLTNTASANTASASAASTGSSSISAASTSANAFGIQLGAFSSEEKANAEWQRLQSLFANELGELRSHLVPVTTAAGNLVRLQARVESETRARAVCAALIEKSQACVVVLPQH